MKRIVIEVSKGELDYIREAVEHKHKSLMNYFDDCEAEANKPIELPSPCANPAKLQRHTA